MDYTNRCVVEYDQWQYDEIKRKSLIQETVESLENIINNPYEYISEVDEFDVKLIINKLKTPSSIGTGAWFSFGDFLNGSVIPENDKIYVIKNHEHYYE
ncbi:hypothetical protein FACS189472_08660 [Alphaproteobacteria bacterium]|nr:hypothetical protein FACS189472_08660 [Alphaproteobacteria bacterium]